MDTEYLPLVTFGRYKGQPITTLMNDTKYLEYIKQQEWLKNYPIVYNICVNQTISTSNQNSKTPEHNSLQNMFLEKENVIKLLAKVLYNKKRYTLKKNEHYEFRVEFESKFNWDILIDNIYIYECCNDEPNVCHGYCATAETKVINDIFVEIKPILGDDYPCVLRKMKTQRELTKNDDYYKAKVGEFTCKYYPSNYILLIKEFNAKSTTKEQLITLFNQSRIKVVFTDDLFKDADLQVTTTTQQKLLEEQEKNKQLEEKIRQLEKEILSLKTQKKGKTIKDYFGKQ